MLGFCYLSCSAGVSDKACGLIPVCRTVASSPLVVQQATELHAFSSAQLWTPGNVASLRHSSSSAELAHCKCLRCAVAWSWEYAAAQSFGWASAWSQGCALVWSCLWPDFVSPQAPGSALPKCSCLQSHGPGSTLPQTRPMLLPERSLMIWPWKELCSWFGSRPRVSLTPHVVHY